ncbi:MAG: hypothetical protein ABJG68_15740 [Crocinitomicaceae bacterium]
MAELKGRLKAYTLFESVVAISIITILLVISSLIYGNVIESEKPLSYYQAKQDVQELFQETKATSAFFTKNFSFETYDIQQDVNFYNGNKKLYEITYTVTSGTHQWWVEKHLVSNIQNAK